MKKKPGCAAMALAALVGGGCEGEPGVEFLRQYAVSVTARDVLERGGLGPTLSFSLDPKTGPGPSGCATLKYASIRFNGKEVKYNTPGGWREGGWFQGAGCEWPHIQVPIDAAAANAADATLEIDDGDGRVVLTVPGVYVRRELEMVSVSPDTAIIRGTPSLEGAKARAWIVVAGVSSPPGSLGNTIAGDQIQVGLAGVPRGRQTLNVDVELPMVPVSRCEGAGSCKAASVSVFRAHVIEIP